ncbi:MAG: DoxX family protein, partial [Candidatus Eremiobacteraeota bacterium]|nr:DoxX family protein [Candidatus Eremiobacteraeota bacterium]
MRRDDSSLRDIASLLARGVLGASIAAHGAQKLYGWFDGPGIEGATGFMKSLGFDPPERYARLSSMSEIAAGGLIAAGALGPAGPALL